MASGLHGRLATLRLRTRHGVRAVRMVWAAAPGLAAAWFTLLILQGVIPAAVVYTTKQVVDAANAAIGGGLSPENVGPAAFWGGVMVALILAQRALGSATGYVQVAHGENVQDRIKAQIHAKAIAVDYAFYESSEYQDKLLHSNGQAGSQALSLLQNSGALVRDTISFGSIAGLLAVQYAWWLPLALLVGTLPVLWVVSRHNERYTAWWRASMAERRWTGYLDVLLSYPDYAGEVRLFGIGRVLASKYQQARRRLREERLRLLRAQSIASFGAALVGLVTLGGAMLWMVRRAFGGPGTLGDLALFYGALNQGLSLMRSLVGGASQMYANTLFLEDLFDFLDTERLQEDPPDPAPFPRRLVQGVTFEDVTFRYAGAERPSLDRLSLELPNDKITAIVGSNGAGKSTLLKLLCRFYEPDAGRILIDGTDVRSFAHRDLLERISVLFQTPVQYQTTAAENIRFALMEASDADVRRAAEAAGAHDFLERLPQGYETRLGKMFYEGGELSGGQWQRVALARAYLRHAPILALDEPTSAMDSWSEMEWFERLRTLAAGRTALIITHRFTVAMQADVIHVLDDGRVVESGSHRELVARGGRYAQSWAEQTRRADVAAASPASA